MKPSSYFTRTDILELSRCALGYILPSEAWTESDTGTVANREAHMVDGESAYYTIGAAVENGVEPALYWEVSAQLPETVENNCRAELKQGQDIDSPAWLCVTVDRRDIDRTNVVERFWLPIDDAGRFAW